MTRVDDGHKALTGLARTYGQLELHRANEAETRFHVIDQILEAVLGWDKSDITVEERTAEDGSTQFADYVLRTASVTWLLEAKRVGATFRVPANRKQLQLGGVLSRGEIGTAVRQAREYCRRLSIPYAAVTNGNCWVVFAAVRTDGVPFESGMAHVFQSLDDVSQRFVEFWELLSRERVMDGNMESVLLGRVRNASSARCLRQLLPEPGYRLGRNALYEHIEPAVAASLSDEALLHDTEALRACYVKTSERVKYDTRLRMHLSDSKPPLGHPTTRVRQSRHSEKFDAKLASVSSVRRFIVLLGPVGAGKTTFLHYTRRVSAAESIDGSVAWLLVDFKKATTSDDPRRFLYSEMLTLVDRDREFDLGDWEKSIRPAYRGEIDALRRGPLYLLAKNDAPAFELKVAERINADREQVEPYVEKILNHCAASRPTYLVIDNVDQIEDLSTQGRIFSEAQAAARRIGCHVIMSLRESTYLMHRSSPAFNAFQFESFYIDAPSVLPVLSHRFNYAKRVLAGRSAAFPTENGMTLRVPDLGVFFEVVASSLLDDDTGFMFEALSGGDIRRGLALVREFLSSGHTDADRALAAYLKKSEYRFPRHEVLKGAVLGPMRYYDDTVSLVPNLFDAKLGSAGSQLLRLRILHALCGFANLPGYEGTSVEELLGIVARLGVAQADALAVLTLLVETRLLRTRDGLPVFSASVVLPTRFGGYLLRVLAVDFAYAEFCSIDTTIFDDDTWKQATEITAEIESTRNPYQKMQQRARRLEVYADYLRRLDELWVVECRRRDLQGPWVCEVIAPEITPALVQDTDRSVQSAKRNYAPGAAANRAQAESLQLLGESRVGAFTSTWPEKDYAFVVDEEGLEWFCHRSDFATAVDWDRRAQGLSCRFIVGEWQGKPRAKTVRVWND